MKKQLMLSTAIATGAMLLLAGQAAAGDVQTSKIDLTIGGSLDFQVGIGDDDLPSNDADKINNRGHDFVTDTELHFNFQGMTDNGITFGARLELEADEGSDNNADEGNIYMFGDFGRIELGDEDGAEDKMIYDAGLTQSGVGGIDGDVDRWFTNTSSAPSFPDIMDTSDATKVTYYTPRFSGFQAGVSYTPDTGSVGLDVGSEIDGDFENHFGFGANYQNSFNGVDFGVAGVFGTAGAETTNTGDDISNFAIGASVEYQGFSVAGSYGHNGDSGGTDDNFFWDIGVGYGMGPWSVSAGYLHGEAEPDGSTLDSEFDIFAVSGGYDVAPGLYAYADLLIPSSEDTTGSDNDATILLLGTVVSF